MVFAARAGVPGAGRELDAIVERARADLVYSAAGALLVLSDMMKTILPRRLRQRYFLIFAANLVCFILILSYAIYFVFVRGFIQQQFSSANINSLSNVGRSVESFVRNADDIAKYYSLFDSEVIRYTYRDVPSDSSLYEFLSRLAKQRHIDRNLHSVYLYFAKYHKVIDISQGVLFSVYPGDDTSDRDARRGNFYDTGWLRAAQEGSYNPYGFILLRTRPLYTVKDPDKPDTFERILLNEYPNANVITVMRAFENRPSDSRGVVVVNLDEELFSQYLRNAQADSPQANFIITAEGIVVSHTDKGLLGKSLSDEEYIRQIMGAAEGLGFLTCRIDGRKSAVVFVRSAYLPWIYVSVVPYAYITKDLAALTRTIALVVLLILAGGVVSQYLLTRKAVTPIERIFSKIGKMSSDGAARIGKGEVEVMEDLLDSFQRNYDHLGKLVFDNRHLLRYNFLNRLLSAEGDSAETEQGFSEYDVHFRKPSFTVVEVAIDDLAEVLKSYPLQDVYLMKQALIDLAEKILNDGYYAVGTNVDQRHVAIIVNSDGDMSRTALDSSLVRVIEMAGQLLQIPISIGVGNTYGRCADLRNSYRDAQVALENRLHKGRRAIIHRDEVNPAADERPQSLSHQEEQIIHHLRLGQRERCLSALKSLGEDITKRNLSRSAVESIFLQLVVLVRKQLSGSAKGFEEICECRFGDVLNAILTLETLEEIETYVHGIFSRLCTHYAENKRTPNTEVVSKIMSYLESHHGEVLSLDVVADQLRITPQYVSRLIKDVTGVNFLDHLTSIRMRRSQELLLRTDLPVREVAARVGYPCYRTFLLHFRASTAMIPTQYRRTKNAIFGA